MDNRTALITGAGVAGPTLAYWLWRAGYRTTLVENASALRTGGYVVDFWGLGYDIAERMGLAADINNVGYHVREVRILNRSGRKVTGFGTSVFDELTNGRFVTVARSELSRLLFEKAKSTTEVIFGDDIVGLADLGDVVEVQFRRAGRRRFDLVIGADGLHSDVRRLAFGPQRQFEKPLGYMVAALEVQGYRPRDEDAYLMYAQPGRMIGRFTLHGDRTLFLFIFDARERPLPATLPLQKSLLREIYQGVGWESARILDALDRADQLYLDRISQIRMGAWTRGRIGLIGDAAFCVSLAAGQGSALAMVSAYVLAGELAKAAGDHAKGFREYEALLGSYIDAKQRGAGRFASALAPRTRPGIWFRDLVIRAFALPGVARLAVGREITDTVELPLYDWARRPASSPRLVAATR